MVDAMRFRIGDFVIESDNSHPGIVHMIIIDTDDEKSIDIPPLVAATLSQHLSKCALHADATRVNSGIPEKEGAITGGVINSTAGFRP